MSELYVSENIPEKKSGENIVENNNIIKQKYIPSTPIKIPTNKLNNDVKDEKFAYSLEPSPKDIQTAKSLKELAELLDSLDIK
jgi:hypothetical protein